MSTGIRSNGDLAANYAGFKFYLNLTQAVSIGARSMPPMLQRDGELWRVRIQPGSDFFTAIVTAHWNEVLNPNQYLDYVAWRMPSVLREHCPDVVDA